MGGGKETERERVGVECGGVVRGEEEPVAGVVVGVGEGDTLRGGEAGGLARGMRG